MLQASRVVYSTTRVVFYAFAYVLLEWLFVITKPSFLSTSPFSLQLSTLPIGAIPFVLGALLLHGVGLVVAWPMERSGKPLLLRTAELLLSVTPALLLTATGLMLFDNFSYTVFGWGVANAGGFTIPLYLGALLAAFVYHVRRGARGSAGTYGKARMLGAACLLLVSVFTLVAAKGLGGGEAAPAAPGKGHSSRPNIVMFASDGINASRTSAYGYFRKTTPNLDSYLDRALVFDNAFTNSSWTTGSVTSMATGQYPASTKVLYPPYTLQGSEAYQTLPRILRDLGYRNIQESVRYYADGPDLNWQDSFDYANARPIRKGSRSSGTAIQLSSMLVDAMETRLKERLEHLFFVREMVNPHDLVVPKENGKVYGISDVDRMKRVLDFIDDVDGPFFAHIHLMDTHCCKFRPKSPKFSVGDFENKEEQAEAAFDDTILEADAYFGLLMDHLKKRGLLENTVVVYSSDHTKGWDFNEQIPLIFIFPDGKARGRVSATAQLLDVTPTLLDYLGAPLPPWLEGASLLREDLPQDRPVFAISGLQRKAFRTELRDKLVRVSNVGPPTYGLTELGMIVCGRWYRMGLESQSVEMGEISTYRDPCQASQLPAEDEAKEMMSRHLQERGFSL